MKPNGFCERKFRSMLITGTLTMAVIYIMLLCDSIIAGHFIGEAGVAAINAITPITGVESFFSSIIAIGSSVLYSRKIGAMRRDKANEIFGQGLIASVLVAAAFAVVLLVIRDTYFAASGISGEILDLAGAYYRWTPVNAILSVIVSYLAEMVFTDGDETCNTLSYGLQIVGNIVLSIILVRICGIEGIILGTVIGNFLGLMPTIVHFMRKSNTLRFVWHFSFKDFIQIVRFSILDAVVYVCWAIMDYVLIGYVSTHYGESGQVTLAVVVSLIEFSVVMDGVGAALQALLGTYWGEKNHVMIKRLMKSAATTAVAEGLITNALVLAFAKPFCNLFGIADAAILASAVTAVRIVSLGLVFCSIESLATSYYMLIDHVGLSVLITVIKNALFYSFLPLLGSALWGETGMWIAFAAAAPLSLLISFAFIYFYYGRNRFPWLLDEKYQRIVVLDDFLTRERIAALSQAVENAMSEYGYSKKSSTRAALFTEEIGLTILEKNAKAKSAILIELSLLFENGSALLIERDSGEIFDLTDPDQAVSGLSSFILSGLMEVHKEKTYLTTTGYNRNMMRFYMQKTTESI